MVLVGVDTTVRDQPKEVETTIGFYGVCEGLFDVLDRGKFTFLHDLVDAYDLKNALLVFLFIDLRRAHGGPYILPDDTSSANVQVPNFAVAHQSFGQPNREGRGLKLGVAGVILLEGVHVWGFGGRNGIAFPTISDTPAIDDDCENP